MSTLSSELRGQLDTAIQNARIASEAGARKALATLAVERPAPHASMSESEEEKSLRRRLRYHARQHGDRRRPDGSHEVDSLIHEVAYEHWHRMLFARFLAENGLLIEPGSGAAITMEECMDLARERNEDPWALAASFAQTMLPQIFREGDPTLEVTLPPETRQQLQRLLQNLPPAVFTAEDALGWTYQFWQSAEKEAVNARVKSGEKITGKTLPAVTQLFTEPYMVQFLLHNTIGAWHAGKRLGAEDYASAPSEQQLRDAVRLAPEGGYDFPYLRFVREPVGGGNGDVEGDGEMEVGPWRPAAGTYEGWPKAAAELKVLDPCCGSGHFLVAAFELLVRLRMEEEGLTLRDAVRAAISDNLFGLELDPRCTQIAAFNVALAAWKLVGRPITLPPLQIACSGIGPEASRSEWIALAEKAAVAGGMPGKADLFGGDESLLSAAVRDALGQLYDLFEKAPELGSLIDPRSVNGQQTSAFGADFNTLEPILDAVLERERDDSEAIERAVAAKGMADAARILIGPKGGYTLVITNVPYLGRGDHNEWFKEWADRHYPEAKNELATIFVSRMMRWVGTAGSVAVVTPQNWLFLTSYKQFRTRLLKEHTWDGVVWLGEHAFESSAAAGAFASMLVVTGVRPDKDASMFGCDVAAPRGQAPIFASEKAALLRGERSRSTGHGAKGKMQVIQQAEQLKNPDSMVQMRTSAGTSLFSKVALAYQGISTGDNNAAIAYFWEIENPRSEWLWFQSSPSNRSDFSGRSLVIRTRALDPEWGSTVRGRSAWERVGVAVSQTGRLVPTRYTGEYFSNIIPVIVPHDNADLEAVWCFCEEGALERELRAVNPKLSVDNGYFGKIPFDLEHWREVAAERYPDGLPGPYSNDPTQWLFHGHPAHAESGTELQVAVARLLGYLWPAELDETMRLSDDARSLVAKSRALDAHGLADGDGIVSLPALRGEAAAADRLRTLLVKAYGTDWTAAKERALIASAAERHGTRRVADTLEEWLQASFFEEHVQLFGHRPFIWHVWDGLPEGFNTLVSYHRLAGSSGAGRRTMDLLTFTYLNDWIDRQRAAQNDGREGAEGRLAAALRLQGELEKILEGEPPYDIFVRWKPLHEQPIGWEPDINDGVRINIRPFMSAEDVGRKGAGILRYKPNATWGSDRGREAEDPRPKEDFPWFYGCDPKSEPSHRTDFGAGLPGVASAGDFDGVRWNGLHYTRVAKSEARKRHAAEVSA